MLRERWPIVVLAALTVGLATMAVRNTRGDDTPTCQNGSVSAVVEREWEGHLGLSVRTTTGHPCTIGGFAAVELVGRVWGGEPTAYPLARTTEGVSTVRLDSETAASIVLTYEASDRRAEERPYSFEPTFIRLVLPGMSEPVIIDWVEPDLIEFTSAENPNTFVGPVTEHP